MKSNYWSCSKFADWLRGSSKAPAMTALGWREWRLSAKTAHPLRYWLAETALDSIQNFINYPMSRVYDLKYWLINRYITKTHSLNSNLKRGQWHEFDSRLLHSAFDTLIDFVEIEEAWSNIAWDGKARLKYKAPKHASGWFRSRTWRCPEAGLDKLKWASGLTNADWLAEDQKHLAEPTHQAKVALEILELYDWWKNKRPNRADVMDASGWSALCEKNRKDDDLFGLLNSSPTEESRIALDLCQKMEEAYDLEDEEMLIKLVRIRKSIWT